MATATRTANQRQQSSAIAYWLSSVFLCGLLLTTFTWSGEPSSGPPAEKRFPPLQVPAGFQATLFACDPLIEYPSVIARGPRAGTLFLAVDYMTGLGTEIVRRDEIRLLEDSDGDGYADRATVFATGFNSIQGLAYERGTVYVMHAPYLTALRDTKGTGKADERKDLLVGLGLPPEKDQIRLHNANGVVPGHDGWLYLALGDRGCDIQRPEGDRLVLHGGGILRCRPDGRGLHIFATGLRNIYDIALDEDLNVFLRDNENDGGTYKVRVCHSFFGADHGYPYHYYERPQEALPPLADLGLGSSAGGVCYLEPSFPQEYRGNLFFCEWGRAVVRYPLQRAGASFQPVKESDFASGAPNDPYGFKPTDLVVGQDGSLYISDWADGQRPRRGRGRIYQIRRAGKEVKPASKATTPLARLGSESYFERCLAQEELERQGKDGVKALLQGLLEKKLDVRARLHAVCLLTTLDDLASVLSLARSDPEPRVQVQAVRGLADRHDLVLVNHRLDAGAGDARMAVKLAKLGVGGDPRLQLEVILALGRLRWRETPTWLRANLKKPDAALAHAAQWALRQSGNWPALLQLLDEPSAEPLRAQALRAVAAQFEPDLVAGLIQRLQKEPVAARQVEYADLLTRICRKPDEWTYWGFRPGPRPANPIPWKETRIIETALATALNAAAGTAQAEILHRMLREKIPVPATILGRFLKKEQQPEQVAALVRALGDEVDAEKRSLLSRVIQERRHTSANRLLALSFILNGLDPAQRDQLLVQLGPRLEDGPVLAQLLRQIAWRSPKTVAPLVLGKLTANNAEVRASALGAAAELDLQEAHEKVRQLLTDSEPRVRSAAALAAGRLQLPGAAERLLQLVRDPSAEVRRASLEMLRKLGEPRALPVALAALADPETVRQALECVGDLGGPKHATTVATQAQRQPSGENLATAARILVRWASDGKLSVAQRQQAETALAGLQGSSGILLGWRAPGALDADGATITIKELAAGKNPISGWRLLAPPPSADARVPLGQATMPDTIWLAGSELETVEAAPVEFFFTGAGLATIWLNGKKIYAPGRPGVAGPYPDRFAADLPKGRTQLLVQLTGVQGKAEFHLRFRRKSAAPDRERFAVASLSRAGNPANGRRIFQNVEKSLCLKCHRVGDQGERVGPELTGLGGRFSKVYIVESLLEPSRTIAPSFETIAITLKNGQVLSGVKAGETETMITLVDNQTKKHLLLKADIDEQARQPVSTMPEGLEKRLSEDEFVDLVSYLVNLKEVRGK